MMVPFPLNCAMAFHSHVNSTHSFRGTRVLITIHSTRDISNSMINCYDYLAEEDDIALFSKHKECILKEHRPLNLRFVSDRSNLIDTNLKYC